MSNTRIAKVGMVTRISSNLRTPNTVSSNEVHIRVTSRFRE